MHSVMGLKGLEHTLGHGTDRIRYLSPVPAGDQGCAAASISPRPRTCRPTDCGSYYNVMIEVEGGQRRRVH